MSDKKLDGIVRKAYATMDKNYASPKSKALAKKSGEKKKSKYT